MPIYAEYLMYVECTTYAEHMSSIHISLKRKKNKELQVKSSGPPIRHMLNTFIGPPP